MENDNLNCDNDNDYDGINGCNSDYFNPNIKQ